VPQKTLQMTSIQEYYVSTEKSLLKLDLIYDYLANHSYWAAGRDRKVFDRSIQYSLCFGVYDKNNEQVGFARVVSDLSVYAYILDLFIIEGYRKKGLSKLLMSTILQNDELKMVRKWTLATRDAHGLYQQFGFLPLKNPERHMELNISANS
jgi:GNAT superfamily N-acetyltransferase